MDYIIRNAVAEDIPYIAVLENACFSLPHNEEQLFSCLDCSKHVFAVACDPQQRILGYAEMGYVLDEGYISNVAVDVEYRRQGIASELMQCMIDRATELKLSFISLEVRESNTPAINLYESLNFEKIAVQKNYYSLPKENAVIMTLFL